MTQQPATINNLYIRVSHPTPITSHRKPGLRKAVSREYPVLARQSTARRLP
jgi:hypothetical protein